MNRDYMDESTFYQSIWFNDDKPRPSQVPEVYRIEVQLGLPGVTYRTYTGWYWWRGKSHRVSVVVEDGEDWRMVLAAHMHGHFKWHYKLDAQQLVDYGNARMDGPDSP